MSSETEKKLAVLDDMILQADQLKSGIVAELQQIDETVNALLKQYQASQGQGLDSALNSFKSFLQSTNNTMASMLNDIRTVASNATKIQIMLKRAASDLS